MNKSELYSDIEYHLMHDDSPSDYLNEIYNDALFNTYPFDMLYRLKETGQSPEHHPEGNVWNHTLLVVDEAAKLKKKSQSQTVFMWAALLHDIGKPPTTRKRKNKITSYDHDKVGAKLAVDFLSVFSSDKEFIRKVSELVHYHMHIFYIVKNLPFADIAGMKRNTDVNEVALLGLCDRLGRTKYNRSEEEKNIEMFLKKSGNT